MTPTVDVDEVLTLLLGAGLTYRARGFGSWASTCPACGVARLSVKESEEGVTLTCGHGCRASFVLATLAVSQPEDPPARKPRTAAVRGRTSRVARARTLSAGSLRPCSSRP